MKRKYLIFFILLLGIGGCAKMEEPEFRKLESLRVKNLRLDEVAIDLGMSYYNQNNFSFSVKETDAKVYLASVFLGNFRQDTIVPVGEKSNFTILLSASIPITTFFQLNLKDINKREVLIWADGSTKIGKAGIFIIKSVQYSGRHRLSEIKLQ